MPGTWDLIVVGGGAAGLGAARAGTSAGARVLLVSDGEIGGECTCTGCVPSKTLIEAAPRLLLPADPQASQVLEQMLRAEGISVRTGVAATRAGQVDWVRDSGGIREIVPRS